MPNLEGLSDIGLGYRREKELEESAQIIFQAMREHVQHRNLTVKERMLVNLRVLEIIAEHVIHECGVDAVLSIKPLKRRSASPQRA